MLRTIITASVASAAIAVAAPAVAGPGHGAPGGGAMQPNTSMGGPSQAGLDARMNSQGPMNASPIGIMNASADSVLKGSTTTTTKPRTTPPTVNPATGVSQGPAHASPTGISHANSHSVLAGGSVPASSLPTLALNAPINSSTGSALGTVTQIISGPNNTIRMVVVTTSTGQVYRLPANSLSLVNGVLTTTAK
jgi:hypothetical protein